MSNEKGTFKRWDRWKVAIVGGIGVASPILMSNVARGTVSLGVMLVLLGGAVGIATMVMLIFYFEDKGRQD